MKRLCCVAVVLCLIPMAEVCADNWPAWRGPDSNGICKETGLPITWSETKDLAWKLPLPGRGGSTPAVWQDRIFLTSGDGDDLVLLCISTEGKVLWKRVLGKGGRTAIRGDEGNDASASPSTDGKHVYAYVGTGDVGCFDFEGQQVWKRNVQKEYGPFRIQHGVHNTPLLFEDRLYFSILHAGGHWVVALDKATGKEVWKVARTSDAVGEAREAYSSPVLWNDGKQTTLVVLGCDYATGHRLSDGAELWRLADLNPKKKYSAALRIISSPIASRDLLVVPTARGGLIVGVKPGAIGTIHADGPFEQWRKTKGGSDVPSPLIHDGLLYICQANSFLDCWDAKTGNEFYHARVHDDRYRASPVFADGKIYLLSRDGTGTVIAAGPKYQVLSTNKLDDAFTASPAISNGRIYLRGFKSLYAIGVKVGQAR